MRILCTGATGYVGRAIVQHIIAHTEDIVVCLARNPDRLPKHPRVHAVRGDVLDAGSVFAAAAGCDAAIHLVGIIRETGGATFARIHTEGTRNVVQACAHVRTFVHMSALGAKNGASTRYFQTKWDAEQLVLSSTIPYVLFRPSVIFGKDDAFVNQLASLVRLPFTPVIGDGQYRLQPVALDNVARLFVQALRGPTGTVWELGGPDALTYDDMLRTIAAAMRRTVRLVHVPVALMRPIISLCESVPAFPITTTQLRMLLEENVCSGPCGAFAAYGVSPIRFSEGIRAWLDPKHATR
jgi:NADH dehydrogenase